jgi:UDP-N-acetyl-D-galactosamine dehydrogenase
MKKSAVLPCVIGLGYVGLPVFLNISKHYKTVGFDKNILRVKTLNQKKDFNNEFTKKELILKKKSLITSNENKIKNCNFYIVTVPTPINKKKLPDLKYVINAFKIISKYLKKNDIVFLESTVYPGTTENICRPILEKENRQNDFTIGYSSERVNPGDKKHSIKKINKVIAFNSINEEQKIKIINIYKLISKKLYLTKNIRNAEMSKLLENTQRDLNISFMNEALILSEKMGLDFNEVYKLARSKWNFLKFRPGLVGGHCLPVDPYYLSYVGMQNNFNTSVTLSGRKTNDKMVDFLYEYVKKKLKGLENEKILIAGITYKKNTSDARNSLSIKIFKKIKVRFKKAEAFDPNVNLNNFKYFKINKEIITLQDYKAVIFLVNHTQFRVFLPQIKKFKIKVIDIFNFYGK